MGDQSLSDREAEKQLLDRLVSQDWRERKEALDALARLDRLTLARAALEIVRRDYTNLDALNASIQLLERVGQPLTEEIIALLTGSDRDLRIFVPLILAKLGGPEAVRALSQAAADPDQSENVRFNAVDALGELRAAEAEPVLAALLNADQVFLKYGAVVALGQIGLPASAPVLRPLLEDPYFSEAAVVALGNTGDVEDARAIGAWMARTPAGAPLAVMAVAAIARRKSELSPGAGFAVGKTFFETVGLNGARSISSLAVQEDLEYPPEDPFWRDLAEVLASAGEHWPTEPAVRSGLARLLAYPQACPVAEPALRELLLAGPCTAPPELQKALNSSKPEEAYAAARLLGSCADPDSLPALAEALQSEDDTLAAQAVESVGRIGGPQAVDLLLAVLEDPRDYLRQAAVDALSRADLPWLEDRAKHMLGDVEPARRVTALRLLARLGSDDAAHSTVAAMEDSAVEVRRAALELLPRSGDVKIARLYARALEDPDENLRRAAAHACAELPAAAAVPLLERATRDSNQWVRMQAVRGLGRFPGQISLSALAGCLRDAFPPVRSAVVEAFAQQLSSLNLPEHERAQIMELLVLAQADEDQTVRQSALAVLESKR